VGFQPGPRIPNEFGGFDFAYPTTLYEWSYVNIPMNAEALALARSKGIDLSTLTLGAAMDTIELIDDNDVIEVDEQWLREAVKQAVQEALLLQATGKLDADGRRYATTPMGRVPLDAKASEPLYLGSTAGTPRLRTAGRTGTGEALPMPSKRPCGTAWASTIQRSAPCANGWRESPKDPVAAAFPWRAGPSLAGYGWARRSPGVLEICDDAVDRGTLVADV
jgi:hypothetical protein